jgi:hypothetical protein
MLAFPVAADGLEYSVQGKLQLTKSRRKTFTFLNGMQNMREARFIY